MLVVETSRQVSFSDIYLERALRNHPFLSDTYDLLEAIPDLLRPFLDQYEADRKARNVVSNFGRPTIAIDCILRLILLKYIHGCSYPQTQVEAQSNMAWKAFAKLTMEAEVPHFTTVQKWVSFFGEETLRQLHETILDHLKRKRVIRGKKIQVDTTVVPANIHYPTDSALMFDGLNLVLRTYEDLTGKTSRYLAGCQRTIKGKILEGIKYLKKRNGDAKEEIRRINREICHIVSEGLQWVEKKVSEFGCQISDGFQNSVAITKSVLNQTQQVLEGIKIEERIVSVFQPWARPIPKGKLGVKCEFGKKIEIVETENGIISDWQIHTGNPADSDLLVPAVDRHKEWSGEVPHQVSTDRGFFSKGNESTLTKKGVKQVSIPQRGKKSQQRKLHEQVSWFKRAQRWRAGGEATIGNLKNNYGLAKSRAKTEEGYDLAIGWAIVCRNLKRAAVMA